MKKSLHPSLVLVGLVLIMACNLIPQSIPFIVGDPVDAARQGFENWVKDQSVAYRNASYETISSSEAYATVKITAEFQTEPNAPWLEMEATVQIVKQANQWKPPTTFPFALSSRAVKTLQASRNATATIEAANSRATMTAAAATQQVIQATRVAQATQQAAARATELAQRTLVLNIPMTIQSVDRDSSEFRSYFKNVDFVLVDVVRADETSVLWHFFVWNHNSQDYIGVERSGDSYIVASNGTKYNALPWNGTKAVAGERQDFTIGFAASASQGATYRLYLSTYISTGPSFTNTAIVWRNIDVTLR